MKTIELIKKVERLGLETEFYNDKLLIKDKDGRIVGYINRTQCFQLDMDYYAAELISDVIKEELFRIVCQYASTPIEEREKANEKMKFTKENVVKVINEYFLQADFDPCSDLIAEIHNLDDTPEKVVVPEFIANYLRRAKTDIGLMRVFEIANTKNELGKWKKEYNWIRKNSEKFAKAWIDGYNIEPEQLYYIPLPHLETADGTKQYLTKSGAGNYFALSPCVGQKQRYTKKEITQVPEVYKMYVKPIEEEEE